jgi:hypothetical protein
MTRKGSIIIETSKSVDGIASIHRSLIGKKWWDSLQRFRVRAGYL